MTDQRDDLPIRLIGGETTPLYLQIVHQFKQLIITHRLEEGARLPAVRTLAQRLEVNPGTVVQAYRELATEGLVESARGRGTVVRRLSSVLADDVSRARLLESAATKFATRARALGIGADDARAQINAALLAAGKPTPVLFVGWDVDQATRYAHELDERFASSDIHFEAVGIDGVVKGAPNVLSHLAIAYSVVTFVTMAPEVERALDAHGINAEIIGVTVDLSPATMNEIRSMSPEHHYVLVTEQRAVTTVLANLEVESGIDHHAIEVLATSPDGVLDDARFAEVVDGTGVVIYTSGVQRHIAASELPPERQIELRFAFTDAAYAQLDARWGPQ